MNWNGPSGKYYITADTGHRISKAYSNGKPDYTAWPANRKPDTHPLAIKPTLKAAKRVCEADHKQQTENRNGK